VLGIHQNKSKIWECCSAKQSCSRNNEGHSHYSTTKNKVKKILIGRTCLRMIPVDIAFKADFEDFKLQMYVLL
jgi:hypothetical protein